jgi:hypothetical protein
MKYLSISPPENMAKGIDKSYPKKMYYPPANLEKPYFTEKTFFTHIISPFLFITNNIFKTLALFLRVI